MSSPRMRGGVVTTSLIVAVAAVTSCFDFTLHSGRVIRCGPDGECPLAYRCLSIDGIDRCVTSNCQATQSPDTDGNLRCATAAISDGICVGATCDADGCNGGVCTPRGCGDGVRVTPEACDDGNRADRDGCAANCMSTEVCGNGIVDISVGETCEDESPALTGTGCAITCQPEGQRWAETDRITPTVMRHVVVLDTDRKRLVLFGGLGLGVGYAHNTWEYDGQRWHRIETVHKPSPRADAVAAYDPVRRQVVLFGGHTDAQPHGDTWIYDGHDWHSVPVNGPSPRSGAAAVFDAQRGEVLLFGGTEQPGAVRPSSVALGDLWAWDGNGWHQLATDNSLARQWHGMAYDHARNRVLMFGGAVGSTLYGDLLALNRLTNQWQPLNIAAVGIAARLGHGMLVDNANDRLIIAGGAVNDSWAIDLGTLTGQQLTVPPGTPAHERLVMAPHPTTGAPMRVFGTASTSPSPYLGTLVGTQWVFELQAGIPRFGEIDAVYEASSGRTIVVGRTDPLFPITSLAGTIDARGQWERLPIPGMLNAGGKPLLGFDGRAGHAIKLDNQPPYGGYELIGDNWVATAAPPPRDNASLAYDWSMQQLVLFGGRNGNAASDETWRYDGTDWQLVPTIRKPPAREGANLVFDHARRALYLFGGNNGDAQLTDAWRWQNGEWTEVALTAASVPVSSTGAAMAYDSRRGFIVAHGGILAGSATDKMWQFDGAAWLPLTTPGPGVRMAGAMVYDEANARLVLLGGRRVASLANDVWEYTFSPAGERCTGVAADGSDADSDDDGLIGCDDPDCAGFCTPLCLPQNLPSLAMWPAACAATPRCGDGVCNRYLEDAALCPADCD